MDPGVIPLVSPMPASIMDIPTDNDGLGGLLVTDVNPIMSPSAFCPSKPPNQQCGDGGSEDGVMEPLAKDRTRTNATTL